MRNQRRKSWLFFVLLTFMIFGYSVPAMADTDGPLFGNTVPSDGRVLTAGSHLLEVGVSDPDGIDASSVQVLINGQPVSASFDYDVASVDPVAETETYDYTRGIVSYRQRFSDNVYSVEVKVKDSLGNLAAKQWEFEVRSSLSFSSLTPASLSSLSNRTPEISAQISSPTGPINPSSVKMLINGEIVSAYFEPITGKVSYTPVAPLIPGTEMVVTVSATDMNGRSGQVQWTFKVSYSQMGDSIAKQDCLKCHTNMPQQHKMSNCSACHNVALRNIYKNSETPPHFVQDSCFRCHYTAGHDNGAIADVPAWWPIDQLYSCEQCHSHSSETVAKKHQSLSSGNCQQCHIMNLSEEHARPGRLDKSGSAIDCYTCHNNSDELVKKAIADKNTNCEACHTTASHSTVHTNTTFTTLPKDTDMNCSSCHSSAVSDEHLSGKFTSGKGYTCDTCHSSSRPEVKAAVANKNLNCEACHIDSATGQPKVHTSSGSPLHDSIFVVNKDSECRECHASNLKDGHVGSPNKLDNNNPMSCATCHDSSNPAVMAAEATGNTQCDACHINRHGSIDHSFPAGYVLTNPGNMNCADCHQGTGLTDIHVGKSNKSGETMSCNTCHSISAPGNVRTAVSSGQKNCDACHSIHQDTAAAHGTTFVANKNMACEKCHDSNSIANEHAKYKTAAGEPITCGTCHNSTDSKVKNAITSGNTGCDSCHMTRHTDVQAPHKLTYIPNTSFNCSGCHQSASIGYNLTGSFHKVSGVTPNTNLLHGGTFISPWTSTSEVGCRGCHGQNPSTGIYYNKLLKGNYTENTGKSGYTGTTELCFLCHDKTNYTISSNYLEIGSGFKTSYDFNLHTYSDHGMVGCKYCHSGNVHSSTQPHFIAIQSSTEPNSGLWDYQHETTYDYGNGCGSCHE